MVDVTYRDAVISDIPEIAKICFGYFPELDVGMPKSTLDEGAVIQHLCQKIGSGKPPMILATCCDSQLIVGLYGLELDRYWWMQEYHVSDYIWYVKPAFRAFGIGAGLRKQAEEWSASRGLAFRPMVINLDRLEAKDRAFRMGGYSRVGSVYAKL